MNWFATFLYRPRLWWIAVAFWGTIALLSYAWQYNRLETVAIEMATLRGRLVFSMIELTRSWNANHGGVYLPITQESPANPYLEHSDKFAETRNGVHLSLVNPAYMTRQMGDLLSSQANIKIHLTSLNPINPENQADEWERETLITFENGITEQLTFQEAGDKAVFRYMAPLLVKPACLQCHAKQGYQVGQVRGGLSVTQPASYITGIIDAQKQTLLLIHFTAFILITLISLIGLWQNRRQFVDLKKSRDQRIKIADELADKFKELEETRNQLLQSEKMATIGQLAAGVAHEINNPISFVNSNLGTLQKYVADMEKVLVAYEKMANGSKQVSIAELRKEVGLDYMLQDIPNLLRESKDGLMRVKHIVQDLRNFSHLDDSIWQKVNLESQIEIALNIAANEIKYKAEIVREYQDALPEVDAIPTQLDQVILNLLMNAVQSMETQGVITVRTGANEKEAWVEVQDTGSGIEPENLNRLFDPFFTTKPVGQGTGLGLSVSYSIMKKHGGRIEVRSELGKGTIMRLVLPLIHAPISLTLPSASDDC